MSKPNLSVVIASHNEPDLLNTVNSIHQTAGDALGKGELEVIIVDDASAKPVHFVQYPHAGVIRNSRRVGCGPSRYIGACQATGRWILLIDAHSRFPAGWYEKWISDCGFNINAVYCAACVALDEKMAIPASGTGYAGATWNFFGPYQSGPHKGNKRYNQTLECVWREKTSGFLDQAIPALMGACYFVRRESFVIMNSLKHLKLWGGDEQELSLKAWLSGGEVRLLPNVRIGHKFRVGNAPSGFVMPWHVIYNKLFVAHTCLPPKHAAVIQNKLRGEHQFNIALKHLHENWNIVETERHRNASAFTMRFEDYLAKFSLSFPS